MLTIQAQKGNKCHVHAFPLIRVGGVWGTLLVFLSSVPRYQHVLISLSHRRPCLHIHYVSPAHECLFYPCLAMQRYNYAERVATCIDDYVQSSRRGGSRGGKSGGGKSLDGGASAETGEAFSTGETVGWGCPRVRCVSSCSDVRLWEYYLRFSTWIGMMDRLIWLGLAWLGVHRFCLCRKPRHGISRCGAYPAVCSGLTIFFLTIITNTTTTTE